MNPQQKILVTVVTGFLGAGKTTFINHLLKKYREIKFGLVENEFGEISIDTKLIKGVDASQMFELKNGCICCTITGEYELVLHELAECFPDVKHLLIETTGVAEPASVIRPFFMDEKPKQIYTYNGTICVVDAIHFGIQPEKEISIKQIVAADTVLINKTELISKEECNNIKNQIEQINPFCQIQFTFKNDLSSKVDLNCILQNGHPSIGLSWVHSRNLSLGSKILTIKTPIIKDNFIERLSYNLDVYKNEIYRVKGILCFENEPYEYILQGVGGSFDIFESDRLKEPSSQSDIVFIGKLKDIEPDMLL